MNYVSGVSLTYCEGLSVLIFASPAALKRFRISGLCLALKLGYKFSTAIASYR